MKIGTRKIKIEETSQYRSRAFLMWADPSGADWYDESVNTDLLPLDLEPGDVIVWTVKFSGVKNLQVETTDAVKFRDVISLRAGYYNCATIRPSLLLKRQADRLEPRGESRRHLQLVTGPVG